MKWSVIYIEIAELHESTETRQERLQIPWWNKYTLSVQEAAQYFGFSDKKIRKIVDEHENADFVLYIPLSAKKPSIRPCRQNEE